MINARNLVFTLHLVVGVVFATFAVAAMAPVLMPAVVAALALMLADRSSRRGGLLRG